MKHRYLVAVLLVVASIGLASGIADAHHIAIVSDDTNPDAIYVGGKTCSSDAITPTPESLFLLTDHLGYNYRLRYSPRCRSVWSRSLVGAPYGNTQRTTRISGPIYTTNQIYTGATYRWSGQVDDAGHAAFIRVPALGTTSNY